MSTLALKSTDVRSRVEPELKESAALVASTSKPAVAPNVATAYALF